MNSVWVELTPSAEIGLSRPYTEMKISENGSEIYHTYDIRLIRRLNEWFSYYREDSWDNVKYKLNVSGDFIRGFLDGYRAGEEGTY